MQIIITAELISAVYIGVSLISQYMDHDKLKSTKALRLCSILMFFWLCIDASAYLINGPQFPVAVLWLINLLAFTGSGIVFISFIRYCHTYISEKTELKRWVFLIPVIVTLINEVITVVMYLTGKLVIFENGYAVVVGGIPMIVQLLNILMLIYVPVAAFSKRKAIGAKAVSLLGLYGFVPIIAIVVVLRTGIELTVALGAVSIMIVVTLLQKDETQKHIRAINAELEKSNSALHQLTEEQEAQLEEITALNAELEENQAKLEESVAEQESQLEEIRVLNHELEERRNRLEEASEALESQIEESRALNQTLEEQQTHMEEASARQEDQINRITVLNKELSENRDRLILNNEIISSISKLYFAIFRIDLVNDFYEEIASDNDVHRLTGHEGAAYQRMMELCDNFVTAEYDAEIREFFNLKTLPERLRNTETIEAEYLAKDGNWHQARFISKKRDENGQTTNVLYVTRLVSEVKIKELEYARKLEEAIKTAEQASAAKSSFLFSMSHDIRTPMNAIIGYTELMERYSDDPERSRDYLQKIKGAGDFLLSLINNVLEMARIESGKAVVDESPMSSMEVRQEIDSVYEELMREKNITYVSICDFKTPYIYCDKVKVNEIYLNLLSNAYKYTPAGGTVTMEVKELPSEREGYILVRTIISDTGIGMSKDYLPYLFDEFSREHDTTEAKIQGTGLGMPIVKKLVELMGGTITVDSELGKGSTFVVTLPHRIADEEELKGQFTGDISNEDLAGKRILLAEDNELNAEIAIEILQEAGFEVERAEDGIVCVDMLSKSRTDHYDLILMDIQMPNMDGYKATRVIRTMEDTYRRDIPIIAMTANAFDEDRRNAFAAGMDGHVAKPIDIGILMETIAEVLSRKPKGRNSFQKRAKKKSTITRVKKLLSEMQHDKALSVMPGGFFAYYAGGNEELIYANEMACKIWGCANVEELTALTGGKFAGLVHPDDYARVYDSIWEQINSGADDLDQVEYRIIRKDGSVRRIMDYGRLVRDAENSDIFYVFVSDITDRK